MATAQTIDGSTRIFGMIGHPIAQVKTPAILNARFQANGVNAVVAPMDIAPGRLAEAWNGLRGVANFDGLIVTLPHKGEVAGLVQALGPVATRVGAVNAVRREPDGSWLGEMFDGAGFLRALESVGVDPRGQSVLLLGAGGAGSAIADAVSAAGARRLGIAEQDPARAEALARRTQRNHPACTVSVSTPDLDGFDIVINATPMGMDGSDASALDVAQLTPRLVVADIIAGPAETFLVRAARAAGCRTMVGREMIASQIDSLFEFLTHAEVITAGACKTRMN